MAERGGSEKAASQLGLIEPRSNRRHYIPKADGL